MENLSKGLIECLPLKSNQLESINHPTPLCFHFEHSGEDSKFSHEVALTLASIEIEKEKTISAKTFNLLILF